MELIYILKDKFGENIAAFENRETAWKMHKDLLLGQDIQTTIHPITLIKK